VVRLLTPVQVSVLFLLQVSQKLLSKCRTVNRLIGNCNEKCSPAHNNQRNLCDEHRRPERAFALLKFPIFTAMHVMLSDAVSLVMVAI